MNERFTQCTKEYGRVNVKCGKINAVFVYINVDIIHVIIIIICAVE